MQESITINIFGPLDVSSYSFTLPRESQPSIPPFFHDSMSIRNTIFVQEQKVPAENEFDADDSRSVHFVAYLNTPTSSIPIGVMRIVPFPHSPHPLPGVTYWDGVPVDVSSEVKGAASKKVFEDRETSIHNGKEPYVKIGRMAVLKKYRGRKIGWMLVQKAVEWLKENPGAFDAFLPEAKQGEKKKKFKGLVCAHAQVQAQKSWDKWGFKVDEKMGQWNEEGIEHVGMFLRVPLNN